MIRRIVKEPRFEAVNAFWHGDAVVTVAPGGGLKRVKAEFSCFVKAAEVNADVARNLRGSRSVVGMELEGDWYRIRWRDPELRERGCRWLTEKQKVPTYEGNVSPVRRWLVDNPVRIVPPRACYLDLETDSRVSFRDKEQMRILCWAVVDATDWRTKRWTGVLQGDDDRSEKELLRALWGVLNDYDQIRAWNGKRFDFPVLRARTQARDLAIPFKRWLCLDHMEVFQRMNTMAAESGDEKQSFALEAIAQAVLKTGKHAFDSAKTWEAWTTADCDATDCMKCRACMVKYCLRDTELMPMIEEETGYCELLATLCDVCGVFADGSGLNPQTQVETFLLRLAKKRGYRPKTRLDSFREEDRHKLRGAYVMEPRGRGIVKDVHVADFKSMYPSIVLTWNLSHETQGKGLPDPTEWATGVYSHLKKPWTREQACPPGHAVAEGTGAFFDQQADGILPLAVEEMLRLRKSWSEKKALLAPGTPEWKDADRRTTAYKISANSFPGVVGSPASMFFDAVVFESITQGGKWLIEQMIEAAEKRGLKAIYGDTDSCLVTGCTDGAFREFVDWCNAELFPALTTAKGARQNRIRVSYEKKYERIVFSASKKYCAAWSHYEGTPAASDSEPEVKGLEYKRGDSVRLARVLQKQVVDLLMRERCEEPERFVALVIEHRKRAIEGELGLEEVVQSKRLQRPLGQYKVRAKKDGTPAAQQPHVMMAHILRKRGRDVGEGAKIDFVCVDGASSPKRYIPAEDWAGECDRHELWGSLVYPPTLRLLEAAFPGGGWGNLQETRPPKARGRGAKAPTSGNLPGDDGPLFRAG